jgi:hypothetical protein
MGEGCGTSVSPSKSLPPLPLHPPDPFLLIYVGSASTVSRRPTVRLTVAVWCGVSIAACLGIGCARAHAGRRLCITQRRCWTVPRKVVLEKVPLGDMEGVSRVSGDGDGMKKMKRTRRGQRRRRMDREDLGAPGRVSSLASPSLPSVVHPPRSHILKRSRLIDQAEEDFHRAMFVNVLGQEGSDCAAVISEALASKYGLEADALQIRRAASNSFLAFFPSVDHVVRALAGGNSISIPPLRLHLRRWSRQASASGGGAIPVVMDVELGGISAHLWGIDTQSICSVDTALFRDYIRILLMGRICQF